MHPFPDRGALGNITEAEDVGDIFAIGIVQYVVVYLYERIVFGILVNVVVVLVFDLICISALKNELVRIVGDQLLCITHDREGIIVVRRIRNAVGDPKTARRSGGQPAQTYQECKCKCKYQRDNIQRVILHILLLYFR